MTPAKREGTGPAGAPGESRLDGALGGLMGVGSDVVKIRRALVEVGVGVASRLSAEELGLACGLGPARSRRLAAAFELGRAAERERLGERPSLTRPEDVARLLAPELRGLEVETFRVLVLDARHRLKVHARVSQGTLTSAPVHPREVFRPALRRGGAAVIVAHNHPSGDPEPSPEDVDVTRRLVEAGRIVGVPLLDHVIWASERWVSLRQSGLWPAPEATPGAARRVGEAPPAG